MQTRPRVWFSAFIIWVLGVVMVSATEVQADDLSRIEVQIRQRPKVKVTAYDASRQFDSPVLYSALGERIIHRYQPREFIRFIPREADPSSFLRLRYAGPRDARRRNSSNAARNVLLGLGQLIYDALEQGQHRRNLRGLFGHP